MTMEMTPTLLRCKNVALKGAWQHPFFLIPLGYCIWRETNEAWNPTMAVSFGRRGYEPAITLHINAKFVETLTDDNLFGVLCHEVMHVMLQHFDRGEGKNREIWNIATDMAINSRLKDAGISLPDQLFLPPRDEWQTPAERLYFLIYDKAMKAPKVKAGQVGQGCGVSEDRQPGSGSGEGEADGQGQGSGEGAIVCDAHAAQLMKEMVEQAKAHSRGSGSFKALAPLLEAPPLRTPWKTLVRRAAQNVASKAGRSEQSWSKRHRRSAGADFALPGWTSTSPSMAIIVDTSGSVSDQQLAAALASVRKIGEETDVQMFLALHDGECYWSGWLNPEVSMATLCSRVTARGGTCPQGAFQAVTEAKKRFDCMVYLTDGEVGTYPDQPVNCKHVIVGIVGASQHRTQCPGNWREILVELDG